MTWPVLAALAATPFTAADLVALNRVSDPQVSPDGLQRRGVESKLLYFPDENHWVLKPANSLQWHAVVLDWLDAHLKNQRPRL